MESGEKKAADNTIEIPFKEIVELPKIMAKDGWLVPDKYAGLTSVKLAKEVERLRVIAKAFPNDADVPITGRSKDDLAARADFFEAEKAYKVRFQTHLLFDRNT